MNTYLECDSDFSNLSPRRPKRCMTKHLPNEELLGSPARPRALKGVKPRPVRDSVFISYAHSDERVLKTFSVMLTPLSRKHSIRIWSDRNISPGQDWKVSIEKELRRAKVAILLVSPDFLASDFIHSNELPRLLDAAANDQCTIYWIPLSECLYELTELERYNAVIDPSRPLDCLNRARRGRVLKDVAKRIMLQLS